LRDTRGLLDYEGGGPAEDTQVKIFEYKGDTFAIIDGDLWLKLPSGDSPSVSEIADVPERRRRRSRKTGTTNKTIEQDDAKRIKEMINAGYKASEIAQKFGVSSQYVYMMKMHMKKNGELTMQESE
jgi:hypothetical protein